MKQRIGLQVAAPALAIGFALLVSGLILLATGYSPAEVLRVVLEDGFERERIVEMLNRAGPYYISGVAVAVGFKMNLFNIGVEGQYKVAALFAAWAGASVSLPGPLHVLFILLVATVAGAAWALIPAILKVTRGVSEVISSIMLNSIAFGVTAFLLERFFRAPRGKYPGTVGTVPLESSGRLPSLNGLLGSIGIDLPSSSRVQSYLLLAALVGVIYHVIIWRTRFGYDLRASGANAEAAQASGVDAKRMIVTALLLSGAFAGLIGLNNIMGDAGRYTDVSVIAGLGFTGIAVALLGRNHPVGIAFAALLWAFMDSLQTPLSNNDLPKQITAILQGVTVLSVVIAYEVVRRIGLRREAAHLRREYEGAGPDPPGPPTG
ncbi:MAG: ABC transporter permease, partial [Actinobacteria bacterium]|nr:ABC transporter permease [Actinomycetota bacterium]